MVIGSLGLQESFYAKVDQNSRILGIAGPLSKTVCFFRWHMTFWACRVSVSHIKPVAAMVMQLFKISETGFGMVWLTW